MKVKGLYRRLLESERRNKEAERLFDHIMCTLATGLPMPHCEFGCGWSDVAEAIEELMKNIFYPEEVGSEEGEKLFS